eukprot:2145681-Prymnesium_polylepis.1
MMPCSMLASCNHYDYDSKHAKVNAYSVHQAITDIVNLQLLESTDHGPTVVIHTAVDHSYKVAAPP